MSTIKTFGSVDERSLEQLERCMEAGDAEFGVLCADHHPGYSQPIGGGIAYEGYVSPSGVGYDIGCGNKAACTELTRVDLEDHFRHRDSLAEQAEIVERLDHRLVADDRLLGSVELPVAVAQLELVIRVLRLGDDEPLEGLDGLVDLAPLQVLRDGVLELAFVDGRIGHRYH